MAKLKIDKIFKDEKGILDEMEDTLLLSSYRRHQEDFLKQLRDRYGKAVPSKMGYHEQLIYLNIVLTWIESMNELCNRMSTNNYHDDVKEFKEYLYELSPKLLMHPYIEGKRSKAYKLCIERFDDIIENFRSLGLGNSYLKVSYAYKKIIQYEEPLPVKRYSELREILDDIIGVGI